jgi:hypothetical protein
VVERAEHEPAAVRAEVASKIMCWHGKFARMLRQARGVSKCLPLRGAGVFL